MCRAQLGGFHTQVSVNPVFRDMHVVIAPEAAGHVRESDAACAVLNDFACFARLP